MNKRFLLFLMSLFLVNQLFAENRTSLILQNATAQQDSTIKIPLAIQTDQEIGLAQFVLEFDSTVFSFESAQLDSSLAQFQLTINQSLPFMPTNHQTNKNMLFQLHGNGSAFFSGSRNVIFLSFRAISVPGETSPLVFSTSQDHTFLTTTKLADLAGGQIEFHHGQLTVAAASYGITVQTAPAGLQFEVDGKNYQSTTTFNWEIDSQHTLKIDTLQFNGDDTKFSFIEWSNGSNKPETSITADSNKTIRADFLTCFQLNLASNPDNAGEIVAAPEKIWYEKNETITVTAMPGLDYDFKNWSGDLAGSANPAELIVNAPKQITANFQQKPNPVTIRVNAGGQMFQNAQGDTFRADQPYQPGGWGYVNGNVWRTSRSISNTENQHLYQTERYGMAGYRFDVPVEDYKIILHFAEIYFKSAGSRIFHVFVEDVPIIQDLDIFSKKGAYVACTDTFTLSGKGINFQDGSLDITFAAKKDEPKISGIEIIPTRTLPPSLSCPNCDLDFGKTETRKRLTFSNIGNGDLNWKIDDNSIPDWIADIQPKSGILDGGKSQGIDITVNRSGQDYGTYNDSFSITSNGGSADISIEIMIPGPANLSVSTNMLNFGSTAGQMNFSITNQGDDSLRWNLAGAPAEKWITSIVPSQGVVAGQQSQQVAVNINRNGLENGDYQSSLDINSNGGNKNIAVNITVAPAPQIAIRMNCGSKSSYVDTQGNEWSADQAFSMGRRGYKNGKTYSTSDPISESENDPLYQSERWGMSAYSFNVPNGSYHVVLHFAEVYFQNRARRVMNIAIEQQTMLQNFDIYNEAGHDAALIRSFNNISVNDGSLDLNFSATRDEPKISAIEILSAPTDPILSVSPDSLCFGSADSVLTFSVKNAGAGTLNWTLNENYQCGWIKSISPKNGNLNANESQTITVTIDRGDNSQGNYSGAFKIDSNGGSKQIHVSMSVPGPPMLSVSARTVDFGSDKSSKTLTLSNAGGGSLEWNISNPDSLKWISGITPSQGTLATSLAQQIQIQVNRAGLAQGNHAGFLKITSNGGNDSLLVKLTHTEAPQYTQRINCGSKTSYKDEQGNEWAGDVAYSFGNGFGYVGGNTYATTDPISGTTNGPLYQSERYGMSAYSFDVANGNYRVALHFAEIYYRRQGQREMYVNIEGQRKLDNLDLFKNVGHDVATCYTFSNVAVTDNRLDITFGATRDYPKISAIEVISVPATPVLAVDTTTIDFGASQSNKQLKINNRGGAPLEWSISKNGEAPWLALPDTTQGSLQAGATKTMTISANRSDLSQGNYEANIAVNSNGGSCILKVAMTVAGESTYFMRVNCGSKTSYSGVNGHVWAADQAFSGNQWGNKNGNRYTSGHSIENTEDDQLYQSECWGMDSYSFQLENGLYEVKLSFAEIYFSRAGKRIFHVAIEDTMRMRNFDIFAEAGHDCAIDKAFMIRVSDGRLDIDFVPVVENPKISAIQIIGAESGNFMQKEMAEPEISEPEIPASFSVAQNYPNPFNPETTIRYELPDNGRIVVSLFNLLGEKIVTLKDEIQSAGYYSLVWNGLDKNGNAAPSGLYICLFQYENKSRSFKMSKVK